MKYINTPNIPEKPAKAVIVDYRINPQSVKTLEKLGISVIHSAPVNILYDAVKGHADMQIHHLGRNRFVCAREVYEHYSRVLPEDVELICGQTALGSKYPEDILYNAAAVGKYVICNLKHTAPEIISEYPESIDVKQGYAKCSIAIINQNAVITSDKGVYYALIEKGIDVLQINPGGIRLDGVSYGFIGGVCGLIAPDILAVNGNIKKHGDYKLIADFCWKYGVEIIELNDDDLYDIGSILPVY